MTTHQSWQDNLDPKLIQRLTRPVVQPGIIGTQMARIIISRSQRFTNRLPLLSQMTQRQPSVVGFQAEQTPIVYAQLLPRETRTASSAPVQTDLQNSQAGKPRVIQAKLAPPAESTSVAGDTARELVSPTLQTPTDFNPLSQLIPQNPDLSPAGFQTGQIPIVYAQPLQRETKRGNSTLLQPEAQNSQVGVSKPTVVQAKFASPTDVTSLPSNPDTQPIRPTLKTPAESQRLNLSFPENFATSPQGFPTEQMPSVYPKSQHFNVSEQVGVAESIPIVYAQPLLDEVSHSVDIDSPLAITNQTGSATATVSPVWLNNPQLPTHERIADDITSQIPRSVVQETQTSRLEINTPLVFSIPSAIAARGLGNQGTTDIPRTPSINRDAAPTISSGITANSTNSATTNFQTTASHQTVNMSPNRTEERLQKFDLDTLVDKVERKLIRKLIVENERRGRTTWS